MSSALSATAGVLGVLSCATHAALGVKSAGEIMPTTVTDAHILSYFSVFYTDLFDKVFVFESLSLDMIRWLVTCCHHVHSQSHEISCDVM